MGVFLRRSFLISVALFSLASTSSLETSAKETHCVEGSKTTCSSPIEDEGDTTDIFHKWTAEGQKFLSQLFVQEPSKRVEDSARDMGSEFRSLFDDLNNAFLRKETSKDEERVDIKIWRALSEAMIGEKEAGGEDVQKPWFEQLSETVDSLGKLTSELLDEKMSDFFQQNQPTNRKASASDESGASFDFIKLFQSWSSGQKFSDDESHEMMEAMIEKAAKVSRILQSIEPERGLLELHKIVMGAVGKVSESFKRNFGHIEWHRLQPFSIFYFLEYMETVQTPSWKRRAHAFAPNVSFKEVEAMHRALYLANLAYMDTEEEIKGGLEHDLSEWKYVTAKLNNAPGEPAHYIAISKDSLSPESSLPLGLLGRRKSLDVLIVVRGTKDFSDVLSDGLLDAVDFRGGKAHNGIVEAGQFIVNRYRGFLNDMMKTYDRSNIKLTLIGHSLGAGAATIAGMLYNEDEKNIEANVVGFGCPSLLSKELSESTKGYVTTIISDSDLVPRLSAPTIINAFFDILSYDWVARGLKDLQFAIDFLRKKLPFIPFEKLESMYVIIKAFLEENVKPRMDDMSKIQRAEVILQPPGRCVHFYRDGNGVSGQIMECDFFDSIEISRTMIDDHLISVGYNRMLLDYMRYNHGDYEFNFGQMLNE